MNRLFLTIILFLAALIAVPQPAMSRSRSKASTSQTKNSSKNSKKKSKKSKSSKKSSTSRKRYSGTRKRSAVSGYRSGTSNVVVEEVIQVRPAPRAATQTAKANTQADTRRKIKTEKPDLDMIREATLDPSGKFYFQKLKKKYEVNDTTMTPEEYRYFYLGYMFQEDFDPYRVSPYSNVTDELRMKPTHTKEEIDTITKYAQLALEDNPFDLRQMSFLVHVLKEKRKDMRAKIWEYRLENLLGAIKSTGTGDSVENAWYVMYPVHEYDMVQLLGYEAVDAKFIEPGYDYLEVQPDESDKRRRDKSAKGFYFNVMVPQQQYELKHPEDMEEVGAEVPAEVIEEVETDPDDVPAE